MGRVPTIRAAKPEDAEEIARLALELGYETTPKDIRNRLMALGGTKEHLVAVAENAESGLAGWVAAEVRLILESGSHVELVGLVVDSRMRGRGIGRALVEQSEHWARSLGLGKIVVRSNIVRQDSHAFFESLGYARQKTQHHYTKTAANA